MQEFFNKHKGVRRLYILWCVAVSTFAILNPQLFDPSEFIAVIALPGAGMGYYMKKRYDEDN